MRTIFADAGYWIALLNRDVNWQNDGGFSSLMRAAQLGYLAIVEHLVSAGANVDLRDKAHSALNYAASAGQIKVFEYLLPLSRERKYCRWVQEIVLPSGLSKKTEK